MMIWFSMHFRGSEGDDTPNPQHTHTWQPPWARVKRSKAASASFHQPRRCFNAERASWRSPWTRCDSVTMATPNTERAECPLKPPPPPNGRKAPLHYTAMTVMSEPALWIKCYARARARAPRYNGSSLRFHNGKAPTTAAVSVNIFHPPLSENYLPHDQEKNDFLPFFSLLSVSPPQREPPPLSCLLFFNLVKWYVPYLHDSQVRMSTAPFGFLTLWEAHLRYVHTGPFPRLLWSDSLTAAGSPCW